MHIVLVGVNHRSAPIELRERLAFRREQLPDAFATLRERIGLEEAAILSTCNRVEIYAKADTLTAVDRLQRFLSDHGQVALPEVSPQLYHSTEPRSVHHLFSVASGLDSMVLGEAEILCQVKHAYDWAKEHGATGKVLNVLFQKALNTAKAVRTHTAIGRGCTSIGTVAVELAEKIFGHFSTSTVLLIGAGKIGERTLSCLSERGMRNMVVMNRSAERAVRIAAEHAALAVPLEHLTAQLHEVDIVICSTSSTNPVLSRDILAQAMHNRHQRPLCLIDLGVPRNVEPSVGSLENVYLFNVDDLQGLAAHHHEARVQAVGEAQRIIDHKVNHFLDWWHGECRVSNVECRMDNSSFAIRHSSFE